MKETWVMPSCLYIVATPIGNLADITLRALETLKAVNVIAAEDTRHSQRLLNHYQITTPIFSLHEHNEHARIELILARLAKGESVALISDAGTPLISDPGARLVRAVQQAGKKIIPLPGACAAITALCAAGLPTENFTFEGFLPAKGAARKKRIEKLRDDPRTLIFYESPHRIVDLITLLKDVFGDERVAVIARELTKTFETIYQAPLAELLTWLTSDHHQQKGEFVVLVAGCAEEASEMSTGDYNVLITLLNELPLSQAVQLATTITGQPHRALYQLALQWQQSKRN